MNDQSIARVESNRAEYKTASGGRIPNDLWKVISAFSNTDGGVIYLGVKPDFITEIGLTNAEIDKIQVDVASVCESDFNYSLRPFISVVGRHVEVTIDPAPAAYRPIFKKSLGVNKGTYLRIGSTNMVATPLDIQRFAIAAVGGAETVEVLKFSDELVDNEAINHYRAILEARNSGIENLTDRELLFKVRAISDNNKITVFGLLAFGENDAISRLLMPTINITVTQYSGTDKVNPDEPERVYVDNKMFTGNVIDQFNNAVRFILSKMPTTGVIGNDSLRKDQPLIPEIVIREALANAIVHRDYLDASSNIQVDLYSDRVEITNPGKSLVPIDKLDVAPSTTRNPLLMDYMKAWGITDQHARGIRTIKVEAKRAKLPDPVFGNIANSFKATIFNSLLLSASNRSWLDSYGNLRINERQVVAMVKLRNDGGEISNADYREMNSMYSVNDDKKANRDLNDLVRKGVLGRKGDRRSTKYYLL